MWLYEVMHHHDGTVTITDLRTGEVDQLELGQGMQLGARRGGCLLPMLALILLALRLR